MVDVRGDVLRPPHVCFSMASDTPFFSQWVFGGRLAYWRKGHLSTLLQVTVYISQSLSICHISWTHSSEFHVMIKYLFTKSNNIVPRSSPALSILLSWLNIHPFSCISVMHLKQEYKKKNRNLLAINIIVVINSCEQSWVVACDEVSEHFFIWKIW